jgi:hypothetical protein
MSVRSDKLRMTANRHGVSLVKEVRGTVPERHDVAIQDSTRTGWSELCPSGTQKLAVWKYKTT